MLDLNKGREGERKTDIDSLATDDRSDLAEIMARALIALATMRESPSQTRIYLERPTSGIWRVKSVGHSKNV